MEIKRKALPKDIAESRVTTGSVSISAEQVFGVDEKLIPELMLIKPRAGKGIMTESLELIAPVLNPNADEMLREWEKITKPSRDDAEGVKTKSWVESFNRKRGILDILHIRYGRPLNYMEVVALLAIQHGLDRDGLLPYVRDLHYMNVRGIVNLGGVSGLYTCLKEDLPVRIEHTLQESPGPLTGDDIGRLIGYDMDVGQTERNTLLYRINTSLNLLDTLNHVVKLPKDQSRTVWIHPKYRYSPETVPEWSLKYKILKVLYEQYIKGGSGPGEGMTKGDIALSDEVGEVVERKRDKKLMIRKVDYALSDLRRFGLVGTEERRTDEYHPSVTFYSLTDDAKEWMEVTLREQRLHEDLRKSLLGEHFEGLSERELDMLDKIQRWIRVRRKIEEDVHRGETEVASSLGEKLSYVHKVKSGHLPWGRGQASRENLERFTPFIEDDGDRGWFQSFLTAFDETPLHERHMLSRIKMWVEMKKVVEENPGKGSRAIATILNGKDKADLTDPELAAVEWTEKPIRKILGNPNSTPWVTGNLDDVWETYSPRLNDAQRELFRRYIQEIRDRRQS